MVLTHKNQYSSNELEAVTADLKLIYDKVISIDSISDAENSRANLTKYFETIKEVGLQHFKSNNLIQLINHCESALNTVKTCLENRIIETDMAIKETR